MPSFSGIIPKKSNLSPYNLWGYWTDLQICTNVATLLPLNIFKSKLQYSNPFRNASGPNEG